MTGAPAPRHLRRRRKGGSSRLNRREAHNDIVGPNRDVEERGTVAQIAAEKRKRRGVKRQYMCVKIYTDFLTKFMLKGNTRDEDKLDIALLVGAVFCWASCMFFYCSEKGDAAWPVLCAFLLSGQSS